jgi:hypothetical protein
VERNKEKKFIQLVKEIKEIFIYSNPKKILTISEALFFKNCQIISNIFKKPPIPSSDLAEKNALGGNEEKGNSVEGE